MLHPAAPFIAAAEASGDSSIMHFFCCLDNWTALCSLIIVLATVESLFIPFALSSIAHYLLLTFWMLLDVLFTSVPASQHYMRQHVAVVQQ
uniref:Uncharacterized protein n=1 Tax=Setaria viridis TaxID=4556 RepID=A0A4U6V3C4_SETVI|nr:hypothetical protein SEVIR_4G238400v2 [Setaria viridis]